MDLKESGALIARLRKANGLTQKQVADKIGAVPKTVSKWETGGRFYVYCNKHGLFEV